MAKAATKAKSKTKSGKSLKIRPLSPRRWLIGAIAGGALILAATVMIGLLADVTFVQGGTVFVQQQYGLPVAIVDFQCPGDTGALSCPALEPVVNWGNLFGDLLLWTIVVGLYLTPQLAAVRARLRSRLNLVLLRRLVLTVAIGTGLAILALAVPRVTHQPFEQTLENCSAVFCKPHFVNRLESGLPLPVSTDFSVTQYPETPISTPGASSPSLVIAPLPFVLDVIFFSFIVAAVRLARNRLRARQG